MRRIFVLLFISLLSICCKQNPGEDDTLKNEKALEKIALGSANSNGEITLGNYNALKKNWEDALKAYNKTETLLTDFKINIIIPAGGNKSSATPVIMAHTKSGNITMAAILVQNDNSYYLDNDSLSIICEGLCNDGCIPIITIMNNKKYLNCTPCDDCKKTESNL